MNIILSSIERLNVFQSQGHREYDAQYSDITWQKSGGGSTPHPLFRGPCLLGA